MKVVPFVAIAVAIATPAFGAKSAAAQDAGQQDQSDAHKPAAGNADGNANSSENAQEKSDPNRKICVKQALTGSRLGSKRVCATAAEWERTHREQQQSTEAVQNGKFKSDHD